MEYSIIVAMTPERVIGRDGQLPWRLSADLRRFQQLTMGHAIIMGRKTFDSIGRLLPGRQMVVVSRQPQLVIAGATVVHSIDGALQQCQHDAEAFFIGGQQIYAAALEIATRIYLTMVHARLSGDAYFPHISQQQWRLVRQEDHRADDRNQHDYSFQVLERVARLDVTD